MRKGATQGIPKTNGRSMMNISADPARFPQSSHRVVAACCARCALAIVGLSTQMGSAVAGALFSCSTTAINFTASIDSLAKTWVIGASTNNACTRWHTKHL